MKYEADFYDQFIKYQKFSFFIKSIKFLYPSNLFLQYSKNLSYFNSSNLFYIIKFFKRILSFIFGLFSNSYSVFRENLKSTRDVLIISHHLKTDTFPQKDFYFGDLSLNLKKNKISFKKILINQSEISSNLLNKKNSTINVEAINKYCNFFIELK